MTDPERDFSDEPTITVTVTDPCAALLATAVKMGLLTQADAASLDTWAGALATEVAEGRLTETEMRRRIGERLQRDISRRFVA